MYRVELYARVRRACRVEGMSTREASRVFGVDRKTVRKMRSFSVPPGYRRSAPPRRPKLGPFTGIIDRILEDDRTSHRKQRHGPRVQAQVRVIDELPDMVFERLEVGGEFSFLPLPVPRDQPDDEDSEEFLEALERHKQDSETYKAAIEQVARQPARTAGPEKVEREARDLVRLRLGMGEWEPERGLDPEELCRRRGIDPGYELPASSGDGAAERHHDSALQTLLSEEVLSASLARLRDRARSSIRQTGVATLFAAFGFLEWFDSDDSDQAHYAPLVLVPGELDRQLVRGRYVYRFQGTGEPATANVTLTVFLRQNFGLELPAFDTDDSPESYFEKVNDEICAHRGRWRVRRFLTID